MKPMNSQKIAAFAAGLVLSVNAMAQEAPARRETVGVDAHYESRDGLRTWSGDLSYGRMVMPRLEVAGAYSIKGGNKGATDVQGIQLLARQWFGTYGKADTIVPFVQGAFGFEFSSSKYENVVGLGAGIGMFVSNSSELRLTLKGEWGGFTDATRLDAGYYYHF